MPSSSVAYSLLAPLALLACSPRPTPALASAPAQPPGTAAQPPGATPETDAEVDATKPSTEVPAIQQELWGELAGQPVHLFILSNKNGMLLKLTNYGATVVQLHAPDRDGNLSDVTRGYDDLSGYLRPGNPYFGSTIGRVANRIRNATFELEGRIYRLNPVDGPHSLHGGKVGWDKVVWKAEPLPKSNAVRFTYTSSDGDEGFPGTVLASAVYTLTDDNELRIDLSAETDQLTPLNMAHHTYWNLGGDGSNSVKNHIAHINADQYTPGGSDLIPTGQLASVAGTPFDFRQSKPIGQDLAAVGGSPVGYDHNFVINGDPGDVRLFAVVKDPASGRIMELSSNQAGMQFYTGNFMDGSESGRGQVHQQYSAFCLESQMFPDAINHKSWRDGVILKPGQKYHHVMVHKFSAE